MRATRVVGALSCILTFAAAVADCSADNVSVEGPPDPLYGFADLHAHLAFHLAYGAGLDDAGNVTSNGIMYGLPGTSLDVDSVATDLAACDGLAHGNSSIIANVLVTQLANVLKTPHGDSGFPDFDNWPLATTGLHQQMHVTWLRHSFEGGQRLMVASAVENSTLAAAFLGNLNPPASIAIHQAEQRVAEAQILFIKAFVAANTDWLAIATTPDEAEAAIRANKMAIVLGTEFDSLDLQEVNDLYALGVRVFIPIHLADNDLGGTAVYENVFNIHNAYMRGVGYAVQHDDKLTFKLGLDIPPTKILGLPLPNPFDDASADVPAGNRNAKGLYGADGGDVSSTLGVSTIGQMMDLGVVIDVAHMSEQSIDDTIDIAVQKGGVPIIDSHTGVRSRDETATSERDLMFRQAQHIGALGGMIGVSTGGITAKYTDPVPGRIFYSSPTPSPFTLTPTTSSVSANVSQAPSANCKGLSLEIATSYDDLRQNSKAEAVVTIYGDPNHPLTTFFDLNHHQLIGNTSTKQWMIPLTTDATTTNQFDFALKLSTDDSSWFQWSDDDWALSDIKLSCGPRSVHPDSVSVSNGQYTLATTNTDPTPVGALLVDVWSTNALGCSNCAKVTVGLQDNSSLTPTCTHGPLGSESIGHITCAFDSMVATSNITSVTLAPPASDNSWSVAAGTVGFSDDTPPAVLIDNHSPPKLHGNDSTVVASRGFDQHSIRITLTTDSSGLDAGIDATATFVFGDQSTQTVRLNRRAALTAGELNIVTSIVIPASSTYQFYTVLANHSAGDIQSFRIEAPNLTRTWSITSVILEAFEDPASAWVSELENVMSALGRGADGGVGSNCFLDGNRCGVALGTDFNGMAPNIPGTTVSPYDPDQPDARVLLYPAELRYEGGVPAGGFHTGNKAWDVTTDGIAQVGLLPDFLVAAARTHLDGGSARNVATVLHSAGDFVRMWKTIETFKKN